LNTAKILKNYTELIGKNPLFINLGDKETDKALEIFKASFSKYSKGEFIHHAGYSMEKFGIILYGTVNVCTDDIDGNRMIMAEASEGNSFGESLCFLKIGDSPVYVYATKDCGILWLSTDGLFSENADDFKTELQKRFTAMLAMRTLKMNDRIQILSKVRLRDKIKTYFGELSQKANSNTFTVPISRTDMATYIGTNRSALTRELSAMKNEGIIDFNKNTFTILS